MFRKVLLLFLWQLGVVLVDSAKKIDALNLLLPLSAETKVEYLLHAFHGCYRFSSSDPAIISVVQAEDASAPADCGTKALLRVETASESRAITWISAQEEASGALLRCEARVAALTRIEIVTRLRTVDVGNFEAVEVIGYDKQGNVFSSLEGLKFQWQVLQSKGLGEFVSFRASGFHASPRRQQIEDLNGQSDQVILRAIKTGRVRLSVAALEQRYKSVQASVELLFVEHIIVRPESPILLLPFSLTRLNFYRLAGDKGNRKVELLGNPGARFKYISSNPPLVQISESYEVFSAEKLGSALVDIYDQDQTEPLMQLKISVAEPESFGFGIKRIEGDRWTEWPEKLNWSTKSQFFENSQDFQFAEHWSAVVEDVYVIKPLLKSKGGEEFTLNKEKINWTIDKNAFEVLANGNHFVIVRAVKPGLALIEAEILPRKNRTRSLTASKELPVYHRILVVAPRSDQNEVFLPSPSSVGEPVYFTLEAVGGSGAYLWQVEDQSVASVVNGNQLLMQKAGKTLIKCTDAVNKNNKDQVVLVVEDLAKIVAVEPKKEGQEGETVFALFRAIGSSGTYFANCTIGNLKLAFQRQNESALAEPQEDFSLSAGKNYSAHFLKWDSKQRFSFVKNLTESSNSVFNKQIFPNEWLNALSYSRHFDGTAEKKDWLEKILLTQKSLSLCHAVQIFSASSGNYFLEIKGKSVPAENMLVRFYQPFSIEFPENYDRAQIGENPLLSFGSAFKAVLKGGPSKWPDGPEPLIISSSSDSGSVSQMSVRQNTNGAEFIFKCKGESEIEATRASSLDQRGKKTEIAVLITSSNDETKELLFPFISKARITIICARPSTVKLFQLTQRNIRRHKFLDSHKSHLLLRNEKRYNFVYWTFDESGRAFWNFTQVPVRVRAAASTPSPFDSFKKLDYDSSNLTTSDLGANEEYLNARSMKELEAHGSEIYQLVLNKNTGKTHLHARIYCKGSPFCAKQALFNDTLTITSTKKLAIEPKSSELLLIPENEVQLAIINGSGSFRVWTSEPKLLNIIFRDGDKLIRLRPLAKGKARILVEDLGLESPTKAFAEVEVVGLESLSIVLERPKILKGERTKATIGGSAAIKAQLSNCDVQIFTVPSNGVSVTSAANAAFLIQAEEEGEFAVRGEINRTPLSGAAKLLVFPPLTAFPDRILSLPECETFFKLVGGSPEIFSPEYKISVRSDEAVGSLSQIQQGVYKLTAHKGFSISKIEILAEPANEGDPVFRAELLAEVALPDGLAISGPYKLLEGAKGFMQAVPTLDSRPFSPGFCDIAAQVEPVFANEVLSLSPLSLPREKGTSHLTVLVAAQKAGNELLEFRLNYIGSHPGIAKRFPIAMNHTVVVYENTEVQTAGFLDQQQSDCFKIFGHSMLLLTPNSVFELPKKISARVVSNDRVVSLLGSNKLETGETTGFDSVILDDSESRAKSGVVVRVESPAFLAVEGVQKAVYMHPHSSATLQVKFTDKFGRVFMPPSSGILCRLLVSDPNSVEAKLERSLSQVSLFAKGTGKSFIFIQSLMYPGLSLVLPVLIGSLLQPQGNIIVHVGGDVQFKSPQEISRIGSFAGSTKARLSGDKALTAEQDKAASKSWSSSASSIFEIDQHSGFGQAKRAGNATIGFDVPIALKAEIVVVEIKSLDPQPTNPAFITNIVGNENFRQKYVFKFSPNFGNSSEKLTVSPLVNHNLDFNCSVNSRALLASRLGSDFDEFSCEVSLVNSRAELPQSVALTLAVWSKTQSFKLEETINVKILTSFQYNLPGDAIHLSQEERTKTFVIRTVSKLNVIPDSQLQDFVSSVFFANNFTQRVQIKIEEGFKEPLKGALEIFSPLSGQRKRIEVDFEPRQGFWSRLLSSFSAGSELSFSDLLVIFICILILLFIVRELRQKGVAEEDKEYNTMSRMSNSRSVNYSAPRNPF